METVRLVLLFIHIVGFASLLGGLLVVGCSTAAKGGGGAAGAGRSDDLVSCGSAQIGNNHGHELRVPSEDVAAKVTRAPALFQTVVEPRPARIMIISS